MTSFPALTFSGKSGKSYNLSGYTLNTQFKPVGAIYALCKQYLSNGKNQYEVLYIGQTGDLSNRFDDHHKMPCALGNGANCIYVLTEKNEKTRFQIEADLIQAFSPPCNS